MKRSLTLLTALLLAPLAANLRSNHGRKPTQ
jgi:hypothetical protein